MNIKKRQNQGFDLNDIQSEPSDEQLQALMDDVAEEVRRKRKKSMKNQDEILRREIDKAQKKWFSNKG